MEKSCQPDYKLDQGFLLKLVSENLSKDPEECYTIQLPAGVQLVGGREELGEWSSFQFSDGDFDMHRCALLSKQPVPEK